MELGWSKLGKARKAFVVLGAFLVTFSLGLGAGRFTAPVKVVEKEKLVEKKVTDTSSSGTYTEHGKKDELVKKDVQKEQKITRHKHEEIKPDGTKVIDTTTTVDTGTADKTTKTTIDDNNVKIAVDEHSHTEDDKTVEKSKEVTYARSNWHVSLLAGVDLNTQGWVPQLNTPPGLVFGAEVERRLFWNLWGGAWALKLPSTFAAGVKGSLEF